MYQRGVINPMINIEQLWKDYGTYENVGLILFSNTCYQCCLWYWIGCAVRIAYNHPVTMFFVLVEHFWSKVITKKSIVVTSWYCLKHKKTNVSTVFLFMFQFSFLCPQTHTHKNLWVGIKTSPYVRMYRNIVCANSLKPLYGICSYSHTVTNLT